LVSCISLRKKKQQKNPFSCERPNKEGENSQVLVANTCNLSYSGGRDQVDHSWKRGRANSSQDPTLKNHIKKNGAGGVAQGEGPEFKPQYPPLKKRIKDKLQLEIFSNHISKGYI
jgi:hypothetical protein